MRRVAALLLLAGLLLPLAVPDRLARSDETPAASQPGPDLSHVEVIDRDLDGKLGLVSLNAQRTGSDRLSILASLKNLTGQPLVIEAQTLYKDQNAQFLDGGHSDWLTLSLQPHETVSYRSASPLGRGARFRHPHPPAAGSAVAFRVFGQQPNARSAQPGSGRYPGAGGRSSGQNAFFPLVPKLHLGTPRPTVTTPLSPFLGSRRPPGGGVRSSARNAVERVSAG